MRGLTRGIRGTTVAVTGLVGGLSAVGAAAGLVALGKAAANNIDRQAKLAKNLRVTSRDVQELQIAADLSGLSIQKLQRPFQQVQRILGDANRGLKSARQAFELLGGSVAEFEGLAPDELFAKTVRLLGQVKDQSKFATLANQLFGRSWQDLRPFIEDFDTNMARARVLTRDLQLGMKGGAAAVEGLGDNFGLLGTVVTLLRDKVFARLAPTINKAVVAAGRTVEEFIRQLGGGEVVAAKLATALIDGAREAAAWWTELRIVIGGIGAALDAMADLTVRLFTAAGEAAGVFRAITSGNIAGAIAVSDLGSEAALARLRGAQSAQGEAEPKAAPEEIKWLERQTRLLEEIATKQFEAQFR
jgi:hypothetical protein